MEVNLKPNFTKQATKLHIYYNSTCQSCMFTDCSANNKSPDRKITFNKFIKYGGHKECALEQKCHRCGTTKLLFVNVPIGINVNRTVTCVDCYQHCKLASTICMYLNPNAIELHSFPKYIFHSIFGRQIYLGAINHGIDKSAKIIIFDVEDADHRWLFRRCTRYNSSYNFYEINDSRTLITYHCDDPIDIGLIRPSLCYLQIMFKRCNLKCPTVLLNYILHLL